MTRYAKRFPILITARRVGLSEAQCIADLLSIGTHPAIVTVEQVRGTLQAGAHSFLLYRDDELLGLAELRAIHPEPERSDAVVVLWMVTQNPVGIGVAALSFLLQHAFSTLGLSEVWGWVRQSNTPMLALCRRLGLIDHGTWAGDPECRLLTCSAAKFRDIMPTLTRLHARIHVCDVRIVTHSAP